MEKKPRPKIDQLSYRFLSSLFIISLINGAIQTLVMLVLNFYQKGGSPLTEFQETAMDSLLLILISAPILWFLVLRPLVVQINREQESNQEKTRLNEELRNALDAHSLVSIADPDGRIVYVNSKFCQVSGYSLEELLGKNHSILNSGYHDQDYIRNMWNTIIQGQIWQGVFCNRRKDGSLYWVENTIMPLLDETGKPQQYISIRQDITAQKETNEKLLILKQAVDASSEMILITNAEGVIQYANPALCQMTDWPKSMLTGLRPEVLDSTNANMQTITAMQNALRKGEIWTGRLLQRRKGLPPLRIAGQTTPPDPLEFWAELNITPVMNKNGSLAGYVQIQRDISAQVSREAVQQMENDDTAARLAIAETLQQTTALKERLTSVLDILFELKAFDLQRKGGIFLRDDDNKDFLDLFLLRGQFSEQFIAKEHRIALGACLCGRAAVSGELLVSDDCFCDPRHEHVFDNMQAHGHYIVPINASGDTLGVLFLYTDPYPVQNENRLTMLTQVGELVALAVLQEQAKFSLEKARDMAMQAALAKSEFLANMSHEIRTPMNGVLGMLDLLRDTNMSRSQWDLVDTAHAAAESLLGILNDILDLSKLEAGKIEIEQIGFNLTELVSDVCALLAGRAHAKKLELNCFIPAGMPEYWQGDPNRIRQVLINFISNAIKFTEYGEVSVTVTRQPGPKGLDYLHFEVRDTGLGIDPEAQTRLFQPFSQAENSTARKFGGTGLGLSISKNLVELMGGTVGLESVFGQGSCFWFTLPLVLSQEAETYIPLSDILGKRVLIVDDNATNRTILSHYLTHWGFIVGQADNGQVALLELEQATANGTPYDLALLDMQMPEMDGLTLARIITETPMLTKLPRILLSSGGSLAESERRKLGLAVNLSKPVKQSQLFDAIVNTLSSSAPQSPAVKTKKKNISSTSYQGKKLLVVEDNKVNQKVIVGMLAKFELVPEIADNGRIALDKLAQNTYDLVLMDCQMPVLDGYLATIELRKHELESGLPHHQIVVALTAHAIAGEREKCLAIGMDDFLPKPISQNDLGKMLARWLSPETAEVNQPAAFENITTQPLQALWNKEMALEGLGDDEELLKDMISAFLSEAPLQLAELQKALDQHDLSTLANVAHTLKGSVSYLCAETARNYAAELEQAARNNESVDYQQMTELLNKALVDLIENLHQFINAAPL